MKLTEQIHFMAGESILDWDKVTALKINAFLFRLKFLQELAKKRRNET